MVYPSSLTAGFKWALAIGAIFLSLLVLTEQLLEHYLRAANLQNEQLQVSQNVNGVAAKLSGVINNDLSLLSGLAAYISLNPHINQAEFNAYARIIYQQNTALINIAAAPDFIISMVYPLTSNRAALGLDERDNTNWWRQIKKLTPQNKTLLIGPIALLQGGTAVIARVAVFTPKNKFWGITSAPIRISTLISQAGINNPKATIKVAIRKSPNEVFYGNKKLFSDPKNIITTINLGNEKWQMVAQPKAGWNSKPRSIIVLRGAFMVIACLLLLAIWHRYRQMQREIKYQRALQKNETLLQEVGKLALVGGWQITLHNNQLKVTHWSEQTARIIGLPTHISTPNIQDIVGCFAEHQADKLEQAFIAAARGAPFDMELNLPVNSKPKKWVRIIGNPIKNQPGKKLVLGYIQDISERKHFTEKIQYQAIYDQLTGLPNRLLLHNRLEKAIQQARRENTVLAVIFIDLDNFKPVNDNLGHSSGDKLLCYVGERIKQCIRTSDTVARYSGDEFIVILNNISGVRFAASHAERIVDAINQPYDIDAEQVFCGASIGISLFPNDGETTDVLLSNADQAMYEVKRSGRNGWQFFTQAMQKLSEKRHLLGNKLLHALENQKLEVYYQPIINLTEKQITKCEALVRWFDNGQQIPTDEFITLAEETGRINEIDRFVIARATEYLTKLNKNKSQPIGLSINVSPRVFTTKDNALERWLALITQAAQTLDITVEITERLLMENSDKVLWVLGKLKTIGVNIAIDDFGTGHSSLSYLTKFPIDTIKIDQSFIKEIGEQSIPEALTETMIDLSHKLAMEVVAEGVETSEQLDFLTRWQCDFGQGYFFSKPLNEKDFSQIINREIEVR